MYVVMIDVFLNKANHKGFDVTKNRLKAKVDAYVKQYVTGHSRGAALGNLLAKDLIDSYNSSKVFSYTFATPNNTTSSSAASSKYKGLFNVLNTDDIVPQMPLKNWGFTNYGQIREVSVAEKYEKILNFENGRSGTFEWLTGHDYNNDSGTKRTLFLFSMLAKNRDSLYRYSDGIKGLDTFIIPLESKDEYYKKIGKGLSRHVIVGETFPGIPVISGGNIAIQTPGFLMQDLANLAGGEKGYPIAGRLVAPRYSLAKGSFIATSGNATFAYNNKGDKFPTVGGMAHPHLPQTYYLIARNNFVALP